MRVWSPFQDNVGSQRPNLFLQIPKRGSEIKSYIWFEDPNNRLGLPKVLERDLRSSPGITPGWMGGSECRILWGNMLWFGVGSSSVKLVPEWVFMGWEAGDLASQYYRNICYCLMFQLKSQNSWKFPCFSVSLALSRTGLRPASLQFHGILSDTESQSWC